MKLNYTYWADEGFCIGFLDDFPGWWTQGKDIEELETMLLDLYDLCDDENSLKSARTAAPGDEIPAAVSHGTIKIPLSHSVSERPSIAVAV